MKILTVFGTRPEAIKMAMLVKKLQKEKDIRQVVCVTAQHREMLDQVLQFFKIVPDIDLHIMQQNQNLASLSAAMLHKVTSVLQDEKPDLVFVHGDTTTCFITTLAAFYLQIKVAHIEAGMRTFNLQAPFPEEANRILTTKLASWHFAPTALNVEHLITDGVKKNAIIKTGNTVIDALLFTSDNVNSLSKKIKPKRLHKAFASGKKIILITGHRRENFGEGFKNICIALKKIARTYSDVILIYPVHLNPRVRKPVLQYLKGVKNIILTDPFDYPDFVYAMKKSWIIITDSGGIQEEGSSLGKPVLVMRSITERPEALQAGTVKLVGTDPDKIFSAVKNLYQSPAAYKKMASKKSPYGDGKASDRIVKWLIENKDLICSH